MPVLGVGSRFGRVPCYRLGHSFLRGPVLIVPVRRVVQFFDGLLDQFCPFAQQAFKAFELHHRRDHRFHRLSPNLAKVVIRQAVIVVGRFAVLVTPTADID